ncbi:MAG TPA: biopolymer transporter TolR, partial [Opitutaceae bacterium]|nr:biopolymer transporter TolR [Opitutaceae bacterium]
EFSLHPTGTAPAAVDDGGLFVCRELRGGCILQAQLGTPGGAGAGLAVRASLEPLAPALLFLRLAKGTVEVRVRRCAGGPVETRELDTQGVDVLQLEQRGTQVVVSAARFGEVFTTRCFREIEFGPRVAMGLFAVGGEARFHNVRLIRPAPTGFVPYRDYIGSDLELIDAADGRRTIVHHEDDSLQAPNWTPNGAALICNHNGRICRFDLATRRMALVDTGNQVKNNNDHALSPDGATLGISSGDVSRVYTVPVGGGQPRLITPEGPSYLHSWSPDGRYLIYTAGRGDHGGKLNLHRIPAAGGAEERLTTTDALDDGSEYTPDGRWIYFNSTRTGRMQVWRMRPDGSGEEQLTYDDTNNWFPHLAPDGRSLVFITYGPEVPAMEHPFYRHVYFRTLPLDGGTPRVLAYVYGGQGSMNVNSWAPDSRRFAFVSNSDVLD